MPNVPSSNNYEGGFGVNLMNKDLGLALTAALATRSATPWAPWRAVCTPATPTRAMAARTFPAS